MNQIAMTTDQCVLAKDNPFVVQRTDAISFDFAETDFEDIASFAHHVGTSNFRGAILGPHGHGKTTLLCDLQKWFLSQEIDCELVFLPREKAPRQATLAETIQRGRRGAIILLDGIERLPFVARQRLVGQSKSFNGFIATTHRRGRLPTLIQCRTSQRTLMAILDALELKRPEIRAAGIPLLSKYNGNMRFVLRELYDQYANGQLQGSEGEFAS